MYDDIFSCMSVIFFIKNLRFKRDWWKFLKANSFVRDYPKKILFALLCRNRQSISPNQQDGFQSNSPDIFLILDVVRREFSRVSKNIDLFHENRLEIVHRDLSSNILLVSGRNTRLTGYI